MLRWMAIIGLLGLTACADVIVATPAVPRSAPPSALPSAPPPRQPMSTMARSFVGVVDAVMPVAIQECRARTRGMRCDYAVVVDDRPGVPANAFYTVGPDGQPIVGFTLPLIADARNADELAFILSHEAAHHIKGHLARGQVSATTGAVLAGAIAALGGGDEVAVERARNVGALYGSRRYSKEFELEADALGAVLARRAGYDPVRGVAFFFRAPDPGDRFLGTHPPNAQRIDVVRRAAAGG